MDKLTRAKTFFGLSWPYLAVIAAHFIWGINFVAAKLTLQEVPPMSLAFIRFTLALIFFTPFLLFELKKIKIERQDLPWMILTGCLMCTLNIALFYEGVARTTAIDASALSLIVPPLSVLIGWTILREKVYVINLVGLVVGFTGAITIIGLPQLLLGLSLSAPKFLGDILLIAGSVCWVLGATIIRKKLKKYPTFILTAVMFATGMLGFFFPAYNEYRLNPNWYQQVTYIGLLGITYITLASSISAFFLFDWGLSRLGVVRADLFQYIEPLVATTFAVILLSENLQYSLIVGGILVGLGAYWGTLGRAEHKNHKSHRN